MTIVRNRLCGPDGAPIVGRHVYAHLVGPAGWTTEQDARMVGAPVETVTDESGVWALDLMPCSALEWAGHVHYRLTEGPQAVYCVVVPDRPGPLWLREVIVPDRRIVITWTPDPDDLLTVHLVVSGYGDQGATVDMGDGSSPVTVTGIGRITHTYTAPGRHTVTATDAATTSLTGTVTVTVKDHLPAAHIYVDSDDPWVALLWINETADGTTYTVDWGDGSGIETHGGQRLPRIPPHPRVPHAYAVPSRYTVRVTDLSTQRSTAIEMEIESDIGMLVTYDEPDRPRVDAMWLATGATWEMQRDGYPMATGIVPASGRVSHQGPHVDPGDYRFEVREIINGRRRRVAERRRIQPTQWDWRVGVVMTWRDPGDYPGRQTVTVNPTTARAPCTVDWGDNSPTETVSPNTVISHVYTLPAPATGWRLKVTETDVADPRVWTRLLGEPRYVGTPILSARTAGAVDLDVEGVDQYYNDDWYAIQWEEGGQVDPVAAVGRWYPAHHEYTTPGRKQITVDGPGMRTPITREVDVVIYPSPTVSVSEALDENGKVIDPTRMTARISVDNSASGGPCWVRAGDGTDPRLCAEIDSYTHAYTDPGTRYVIAASSADPTAKGRAAVTVPFAQTRTLHYTVEGVPNPDKPTDPMYKVKLTVTAHTPGKPVLVQWETLGEWITVPPSNELPNTYPPMQNFYDVTVRYGDNSESWTTTIEIPWTEE